MRMTALALAGVMVAALVGLSSADEVKDKPKHTIKEVMKQAHKDKLLNKVTGGTASKEQQKELLELYQDLSKNVPPRGDLEAWKKQTDRMVTLAEAVVNGDEKAPKQLVKTVNCQACHQKFKGKG
jgi:hypothetical protein